MNHLSEAPAVIARL